MRQAYGRFPSKRPKPCNHDSGNGGGTVDVQEGPYKRIWGPVSWDSESYEPRLSGYTFTPEQIKALPHSDNKATVSFYTKATGTTKDGNSWWMIAIPHTYGTASMMAVGGFNYTFQSSDLQIDNIPYRVYFLAYPIYSSLSVLVE
jgi:hypothetical protein